MARRKKRRSSYRRRRRSVGAINNQKLMTGLGVVGGLMLTAFINDKLSEVGTDGKPKVDPLILAAGEVLVGFFGPEFILKGNPLISGAGLGMMGAGAINAAKEAGIISGLTNVVNGWNDMKMISGVPEFVQQAAGTGDGISRVHPTITGINRGQQYDGFNENSFTY